MSRKSDYASSPRFVETVPRKGYRFLTPVEVVRAAALDQLEHAAVERSSWVLLFLGVHPLFEPPAGDPRFAALRRPVGVEVPSGDPTR